MRNAECGMRDAECGVRSVECGVRKKWERLCMGGWEEY